MTESDRKLLCIKSCTQWDESQIRYETGSCISMFWIIKSHLSLKWRSILGTDGSELTASHNQDYLPPIPQILWSVQFHPFRAGDTYLILLILLLLFYLCCVPLTCSDVRQTHRESRLIGRQQTSLDIVLIGMSNNFPSLVWWSLCTKMLSWNEPGTLSVTPRASCSLRHHSVASRSFAWTVISVERQNSFTRAPKSHCISTK